MIEKTLMDFSQWEFAEQYPFIEIHYYLFVSSEGSAYDDPRYRTFEDVEECMDALKPWEETDSHYNRWIVLSHNGWTLKQPIYPEILKRLRTEEHSLHSIWNKERLPDRDSQRVHYWAQLQTSFNKPFSPSSIEDWKRLILVPTLQSINKKLGDKGIGFMLDLWARIKVSTGSFEL